MKKSPIENKVLASRRVCELQRYLFQPVIDDTIELPGAVLTLVGQLPDGVTFNQPTLKPFTFPCISGRTIMPSKRVLARSAIPSLLTVSVMAVPLNNARAERTAFF